MKKILTLSLTISLFTPLAFADEAVAKRPAQEMVTPTAEAEVTKLSGQVTDIKNSIVFTMKDEKGAEHVVRLAHIWTPYANKPYGKEAIAALKDIVGDKKVECTVHKKDRFGKNISEVTCEDKSVQAQMVELGLAWVHKKFNTAELLALQDKAKEARRGVWALPNPPGSKKKRVKKA